MKDFEGKKIKVILNSTSGWVSISGSYIKQEDNFLVILDSITKKIHYLCMYYIKSVEVISDIKAGE